MPEPFRSHVGQQIGNYRLIRLLGQGGFAEVYLGEHIFLKTQAAIKLLTLRLASDNMDSFLNEAQTIAKLRHPHIVHVFECGIENGMPFLVMDYIPNGTLRQRHPRGSRLLPEQTVQYIQQIASALSYAHQQRFIHRDIKPENMLLGHNGEVMLSDFGLALMAQSSGSQTTKEMAGTIPYMAPEQLEGRPRIASDQYALGIVMYEWLCGERPFSGSIFEIMSQHMLTPPPSLRQKLPELSPAVEQVVFKALAKDPAQRFENVLALSSALTNAVQDSTATYVPPQASGQQSRVALPSQATATLSTWQLPSPLEQREQNTELSSTGSYSTLSTAQPASSPVQSASYPITPSEVTTYRPGESGAFSGHYPPQSSGVALEYVLPKSQKRLSNLRAIVYVLLAFLLIAGSATVLLIHLGIIVIPPPPATVIVSHNGTTTTPPVTQTVQSATPSLTRTTSPLGQTSGQTTVSPTPTQVTPSPTGTPQTVTPTPIGFAPQYTVVAHTVQVALPVQADTTVSARCLSGEQMLSGGFYMSDRVNPVFESYPSASDTWTVTASSGFANATLSVTATCLQANFSAHIQIFSFNSSRSNPNTFTCPAGSVLTGGGFRAYAARAEPVGNGWLGKPALGSGLNTNYVLCATTNLIPVAAQSTAFSAPPQASTGLQTLTCPAGSQLTGGGFTYDYSVADVYANVPRGDSPVIGWSVGVYNNDSSNTQTASIWAICVQVPSTVH